MAHLGEVRDHYAAITALGARVLAVSFAAPAMAAAYHADHALPFPLAADPTRAAYGAYGLGRGATRAVYRPSAVLQHAWLRLRGWRPGPYNQADVAQLGGDFVIGPAGRLALAHPSVAGDDRPALATVLAALRGDVAAKGNRGDR